MKKSRIYIERIRNQFGGFFVRVLKNEIRYIHWERSQAAAKEKSLDNLSEKELYELAVQDDYFHADHIFHVCGKDVVVSGDMLADITRGIVKSVILPIIYRLIFWKRLYLVKSGV